MKRQVHPDYVAGEPIPRVVLRMDEVSVALMKRQIYWWRRSAVMVVVLFVLLWVYRPGFLYQIGAMGIVLGLWLFPMFGSIWALREWRKKREASRDRWCVPARVAIEHPLYLYFMLFSLQAVQFIDNGLWSLFIWGGICGVIVGILLIVYSRVLREPGQISCERCCYELVGLVLPCECPECGKALLNESYTTDRVRVRSPWLLWGGAAMVLVCASVLALRLVQPGLMYTAIPRSTLIRMAATDSDAFEQMTSGGMTASEEAELRGRVYDMFLKDPGRSGVYEQEDWFVGNVLIGMYSDEEVSALYREIGYEDEGVVWIVADDEVRVGDRVELSLRSERLRGLGSAMLPGYFFGGFQIGDDQTLRALSARKKHGFPITQGRRSENPDSLDGPYWAFEALEAGELVVRAKMVWVLFASGTANRDQRVEWDAQGEPVFAVEPIWSQTVDLEHRILIVE